VFSLARIMGTLLQLGVVDENSRGPVGYELLTMLAQRQLDLRQSAILDGMVGQAAMRTRWRTLAGATGSDFRVVECVCSDLTLHRRRIEARHEGIPGWPDPDWDHVEKMRQRYEPWQERRLVIDAVDDFKSNRAKIWDYLSSGASR
jgi:predicted kinase